VSIALTVSACHRSEVARSPCELLTSPALEEGLFAGARALSGGGRRSLFNRPLWHGTPFNMSATGIDQVVPRRHGVRGNSPEALAALRALDAAILTGGQDMERLAKIKLLGGPLHGVPVVDGTIVTAEPEAHFQAGHCKRVPLVIGTVARDVPAHFTPHRLRPLQWFGVDKEAAREAYGVPAGGTSDPQRPVPAVHGDRR
jgi:para-nitrobenzyl esterase